ncbi:MAG: autotransporter-associated beta strand repeat-containing protein [Planctomycetia bacterium]|nr:autotransporter-associated beta strand repeat-containing protein [Planctomycetia bacterium]
MVSFATPRTEVFSTFRRGARVLATALLVLMGRGGEATAADISLFQSDPLGQSSFNTGTSWNGGAVPTAGNNYFTGAYTLRTPNDSSSDFTFAGDALTIDVSGALRYVGLANSTPVITINNLIMDGGLLINGANEIASGTSTLTLSGSMTLKSNSGLNLGSADSMQHNVVLNSTLTGTGGFYIGTSTVSGSINPVSTVTINGNNSGFSGGFFLSRNYTDKLGGTVILNGTNATYPQIMSSATIRLGHVNALGTGQLGIDAGTVDLNGFSASIGSLSGAGGAIVNNGGGALTFTVGNDNTTSSYSGSILDRTSGAGTLALTKVGNGVLTLSGSNSYTGGTRINAGVLAFGHTSALGTGTVTIGSGTLRAAVSGTVANPIATNGSWIDSNGNTVRLSGVISGSNGLTKAATSGTLTLAGDNTFTGNVVVDGTGSSSVLVATRNTSLGTGTKTVTVTGFDRTLALDGSGGNITLGSNISYSLSNFTTQALWNLAGNNTISGSISMTVGGGDTFIRSDAGSLTLAGNIGVSSANLRILTLTGSAGGTVSGTLWNGNGTTALAKTGAGTWTLSGSNTYTGGTQINAGVLAITNTSALGTGTVTISSGTLRATMSGTLANPIAANAARVDTSGNAVRLSGVISGSNGFTKVATSGTLTLAGDNTFTGDVTLDGSTTISPASVLVVTRNSSLGTGAKTVSVAGYGKTLILDGSGGDITLGSTIGFALSNDGGPSQALLNLAGNNTISGSIGMTSGGGGTIIQSDAGSLTLAGNISSNTGLRRLTLTGSAGGTVSGNVGNGVGTVGITKTGAGTWTLSGSNTYSSTTTGSAGVLIFGRQAALYGGTTASWTKSNITFESGATLGVRVGDAAGGFFDSTAVDTLLGAGGLGASDATSGLKSGALFAFDTTNATGGSFTYASTIANSNSGSNVLGIVKLGSGTLTLSASNTYTGGATVSVGRLTLGQANALGPGTATVSGGELNIATYAPSVAGFRITSGTLLGTGTLTSSSTYDVQAGTVLANLGGSVGLTKSTANTVTLAGNNTYSGVTTVSAGTLALGSGGTAGSVAGNITNNAALVFNRSDNITYSGVISGSGSVQKLGASTLTLGGSATTVGSLLVGFNDTSSGTNTLAVAAASAVSIGTGASDQLGVGIWGVDMPSTVTSVLDLRNATSLTINVGRIRVGVNDTTGSTNSAKSALLQLPGSATITSATSFVIGDSGAPLGLNNESVTTTGTGTITLRTPTMTIGASKATGSFTLGVGTLDLAGTAGGRASLAVGDFSNSSAATGSSFAGTADFSAGTLVASLSSLVVGRMNQALAGSEAATLTLGTSASNRLDISGAAATNGAVMVIGRNLNAGTGLASGTVTIGNLDSASQIVATDNGTAILLGSRTSTGPAAGTLNLNGGTLTITTTGTGITGGSGTSTVNFNGTTLRAGATSANWITGLTTANVQAGGALFDTNAFNVTVAQAFSGTGGLTKLGAGTLTLTGSSTYSGQTRVSSGVLALGAANAVSNQSNLLVNGGSFDLATFNDTVGTVTLTSGSILGSGTLTGSSYDVRAGTVLAILGGTAGLTKSTAGTVTLSGANTYSGATIIQTGTLLTGIANAISGNSAITIGSAASRGFLEIDHPLSISSLTFTGSGGDISSLSTGTATFFATSGTATITVLGGTNAFHANATLASPTVVDVASNALFSFHNNLAGGASLTKSGAGTMELTSADNDQLSGNLFITAGRVNIGSGMNQIGTGTTTLSGGSIIDLGGQSFTDRIVVLNGTILNAGGTATTTTIAGPSTISGTTTLLGTYNITSTGSARFESVVGNGSSIMNVNVNSGGGTGGQAVFASAVSGSANVTVYAGGTATFADTVSGYVISHGASTFNGSFLSEAQVQGGGSATFAGATGAASTVAIASGGRASFAGTVAGQVNVSGSATFGSASSLTGSLYTGVGGVATLDNVASAIAVGIHNDGQLIVNRTSGNQTISGLIQGSGSLVKQGAGLLVLDGPNSGYSGSVTITGGTIQAGNGNALGTGAVAVNAGGLDLKGNTVSIGTLSGSAGASIQSSAGAARLVSQATGDSTFAGVISDGAGTVGFTKNGAGRLTFAAAQTYTGSTIVSSGVLALGAANAIANQSNLSVSGGSFDLATFNNTVGAVTLTSGSIIGSGTLSGSSYALQGGQVTARLGPGAITVSTGTITLGSAGRLNSASGLTISSGQLTLGGSESVASLVITGGILGGVGNTLTSAAFYDVQAGSVLANLGGSVGLTKSTGGTVVLSGANTYSGQTTVSSGVLAMAANGSFANSQTIVVGDAGSSGAVLDLTAKSGTFAFGSDQTLKGGGTITLASNTVLNVQGTFSPGNSPGLFTYDGGTTLLSGTSIMEIFGTTRATQASHDSGFYDAVNIINGSILNFNDSALTLDFNQSFADFSTFALFMPSGSSSLLGTFGSVNVIGSAYTGLNWTSGTSGVWMSSATTGGQTLEFNPTTGVLVIVPEPGSLALAAAGLGALGGVIWKRRRLAGAGLTT